MFPVPVDPVDEALHDPGFELFWSESWYFDFAARDGSLGGYVRVGLYPNLGVIWYWACLVGEGRPLVTVIDHEIPPARTGSLEVRTSGLWADHNCETPLDHWSLGLEAFAVAFDDPAEAYGAMWGERVPFGFDLEWETNGGAFRYPPGVDRYEVPCRVHGEVLVGAETLEIDAVGQRDHSWGVRDWWDRGWCWTAFQLDDATKWHALVTDDEPEGGDSARVAPMLGPDGMPDGASLSISSTPFTVDPVGWAPILLTAPDGRQSRLPRALARFRSDDGRAGVGWIEFNQPTPSD
jgi:hypothetical protein